MKNKLKKIISLVFVVFALISWQKSNAQLVLNCESGNRSIEQGACWAFGSVSYTNNSSVISGTWSTRSNQLTNPAPTACWVKTPWMKVGTGEITMKTRLEASNGTTRGIIASYVSYDPNLPPYYEGTPVQFYSWSWPSLNTNIYNLAIPIPVEIENSNSAYKIRISFVGTGGNSRATGDDYIFPGIYWSDPMNSCLPLPLIEDTDGDGVADEQDNYPDDTYRAYNNYYPGENQFGAIAFEDLWPAKGDFDFNDMVIDYKLNAVTNAENSVVEIKGQFVLKAAGASFNNGFGFNIAGITNDHVTSVTGFSLDQNTIFSLNDAGFETGQDLATVIVFDKFRRLMPHPGSGVGINTDPSAPYVQPATININLIMINNGAAPPAGTINLANLNLIGTFNPFVVIDQVRGRELHLPDYPPTNLMNTSLFNTLDDDSNPGIGKYFKTSNNLPWGINIYGQYDYPIEKADIINAHLHFGDWAESSGVSFPDWFEYFPGYRDDSKIYQQP